MQEGSGGIRGRLLGPDIPGDHAELVAQLGSRRALLRFPGKRATDHLYHEPTEALNSKLRRPVRTRGHFPNDDAAMKLLCLVLNHAAEEWKRPPGERGSIPRPSSILAVEMANRESRSAWRDFLVALKARGLKGVELVVSDDHAGLVAAIGEVIPEAAWQRCYLGLLKKSPPADSIEKFIDPLGFAMLARKERDQLELFMTGSLRQLILMIIFSRGFIVCWICLGCATRSRRNCQEFCARGRFRHWPTNLSRKT